MQENTKMKGDIPYMIKTHLAVKHSPAILALDSQQWLSGSYCLALVHLRLPLSPRLYCIVNVAVICSVSKFKCQIKRCRVCKSGLRHSLQSSSNHIVVTYLESDRFLG